MNKLVNLLRALKDDNHCDCDLLVTVANIFKSLGMTDLYNEFGNMAIEKDFEKEIYFGGIAIAWAGDNARDLGMDERAMELYKNAIHNAIDGLNSEGICTFGEIGDEALYQTEIFIDLSEELGMKKEKYEFLEALLKAVKEDGEMNDSIEYMETLIENNKESVLSDMLKAEAEGDLSTAFSIAQDAGLNRKATLYKQLQDIKKSMGRVEQAVS